MTSENDTTTTATVEDAISALAHLGVTGSASIGTAHDPAIILGWCQWAEERRRAGQQVGTGLIVRNIRSGDKPPQRGVSASASAPGRKLAERVARFRERALPFPPGAVSETHATAELRRRSRDHVAAVDLFPEDRKTDAPAPPDDRVKCDGDLVVVDRSGMVVTVRCDTCREEWTYPPRALSVLPPGPLAVGRRLPSEPEPVTRDGGWLRGQRHEHEHGEEDGLRSFNPLAALGVSPEQQESFAGADQAGQAVGERSRA